MDASAQAVEQSRARSSAVGGIVVQAVVPFKGDGDFIE